jgi:hypothetical protein
VLYVAAFLLLWTTVFLGRLTISSDVALFFLLFMSAAIGNGLHSLVGLQSKIIRQISTSQIAMDFGISIVIAFGLALIYLIGGISFTGKVVTFAGDDNTFYTVAISLSLLGLVAGYLQPL